MEKFVGEFGLAGCQQAADAGQLQTWVHAYLLGGEWANPGLSEGLKLQRRWWRGPLDVPLMALQRALGPEEGMEYQVDLHDWLRRTGSLMAGFRRVEAVPPLIVEYRAGILSVRDGNHRLGAMERLGWPRCWVVVWYNSEEDFTAAAFKHNLPQVGR